MLPRWCLITLGRGIFSKLLRQKKKKSERERGKNRRYFSLVGCCEEGWNMVKPFAKEQGVFIWVGCSLSWLGPIISIFDTLKNEVIQLRGKREMKRKGVDGIEDSLTYSTSPWLRSDAQYMNRFYMVMPLCVDLLTRFHISYFFKIWYDIHHETC